MLACAVSNPLSVLPDPVGNPLAHLFAEFEIDGGGVYTYFRMVRTRI